MVRAEFALERREIGIDAICLALITFLSAVPYVASIGFYSDDWGLIGEFLKGRTTFADILGDYPGRPIQGAYILLLFKVFDLNPLGYHLVNTLMIGCSVIALYLLLVRVCMSRAEAFAVTALFLVLPQLSTIRVWVATVQVPLSMLAALASMHAQLSFMRSGRWIWVGLAVAGATISLFSYEIFAPLIVAFPLVLVIVRRYRDERGRVPRMAAYLATAGILTVLLSVMLKLAISDRIQPLSKLYPYLAVPLQAFDPHFDWRTQPGPNLFAGFDVYGLQTLKGWAVAIRALADGGIEGSAVAAALGIGALSLWRLWNAKRSRPALLAAAGLAVFLLGHAVFLVLGGLLLSPTGLSNRVTMAAAPGLAMMIVVLVALGARLLPARAGSRVFACCIALLATVSTVRLAMIESYWVEAFRRQKVILQSARRDLAGLPPGSTVILDGVCPYTGPGVVFETYWDVGPALSIALNRNVAGDIATDRTRIGRTGFQTSLYGELTSYPFGPGLFAYRPHEHRVVPMTSAGAAHGFFNGVSRPRCPASYPGQGELI